MNETHIKSRFLVKSLLQLAEETAIAVITIISLQINSMFLQHYIHHLHLVIPAQHEHLVGHHHLVSKQIR